MANNADIDEARLKSQLSDILDTDIVEIDVLGTDPNLVIRLSTRHQQNAYILRTPSPLKRSNLTAALRQEYELLERLEETAVPVPSPVVFCDDASIIGESFYVRTHRDGVVPSWGEDFPDQYQNETARAAVAERMVETLVEIHSLDVAQFEDVCETVPPAEEVRRGIDRLDRATEVTGRDQPPLRDLADWLLANAPADTTTALVHGDYKPDNVLLSETAPPTVVGVIDWEIATLGDPLTDLGMVLQFWHESDDPTVSIDEIEEAYPNSDALDLVNHLNEHGFWSFTDDPGSPSRREVVAQYEQHANESVENIQFYRALAAFTIATFWEFCHRQCVAAGDDSWEPQIDYRPLADYMAAVATSIVDGRFEL